MNEQLLKTSGADVLSSRKKNSEKPNPTPNPLVRPRVQSQDLVSTNFDIKDILFGHFCSNDDDSILVNYIILESKYLIFRSKLSRSPLSTSLLCAKCIKNIHKKIKITNSTSIQEPLLPLMELQLSPRFTTPSTNVTFSYLFPQVTLAQCLGQCQCIALCELCFCIFSVSNEVVIVVSLMLRFLSFPLLYVMLFFLLFIVFNFFSIFSSFYPILFFCNCRRKKSMIITIKTGQQVKNRKKMK